MSVQIRSFGSFEGKAPDPEAVKQLILASVRRAALGYSSFHALSNHLEDVANAAHSSIAHELHELGASGKLAITAFTISEQDSPLIAAAVRSKMPPRG